METACGEGDHLTLERERQREREREGERGAQVILAEPSPQPVCQLNTAPK